MASGTSEDGHMTDAVLPVLDVRVRTGEVERLHRVVGRQAWALLELVRMGHKGCSYAENPAPRWPAYVFRLRQLGIEIETQKEWHQGPFPGVHARYVLKSRVSISNAYGTRGVQLATAS
jgi:hypothetical protein